MCDSFQFPSGHDGQALRLRDVEVRDWILDFWFRLHLSNLLCIQYTAQTSLCFRSQKISRVVAWFNWVQMGLTPSKMFFLWMWSIKRTYLGHLGSSLCVPSGVSAYCAFGLWNKIPGTLFREAICGYWTCGKKKHIHRWCIVEHFNMTLQSRLILSQLTDSHGANAAPGIQQQLGHHSLWPCDEVMCHGISDFQTFRRGLPAQFTDDMRTPGCRSRTPTPLGIHQKTWKINMKKCIRTP
jgi:hypothetical protein